MQATQQGCGTATSCTAVDFSYGGWLAYAQSASGNPGPSIGTPPHNGDGAGQVLTQTVAGGGNGQFFDQDFCGTPSVSSACLGTIDPNLGYILDAWVYPVAGTNQVLLQWGGDRATTVVDGAGITIDPEATSFGAWGQGITAAALTPSQWHEVEIVAHPNQTADYFIDGSFVGMSVGGHSIDPTATGQTQMILGDDNGGAVDPHQILFDDVSLQQLPADTVAPDRRDDRAAGRRSCARTAFRSTRRPRTTTPASRVSSTRTRRTATRGRRSATARSRRTTRSRGRTSRPTARYFLRAQAVDLNGNVGTSSFVNVTVTNAAPPSGPTNGRIVYDEIDASGSTNVYSANPDGSHIRQLTSDPGNDEGAEYSPDGTKIVWGSDRTGLFQIYSMNADGSNPTRLTFDNSADSTPSYSPDGTKIAYVATIGGHSDIWVMNAAGTNQVDVTNTPGVDENSPAWSPDGTKLAFSCGPTGAEDICVQSSDGTGAATNLDELGSTRQPRSVLVARRYDDRVCGDVRHRCRRIDELAADSDHERVGRLEREDDLRYLESGELLRRSVVVARRHEARVHVHAGRPTSFEIETMNPDGSGIAKVTNNSFYDGFPNWGTEPLDTSGGGGGNPEQTGPTYTVNTAQDITDATGCTIADCSLHEAITAANAGGVPATIDFAILSGSQTIDMNQQLPTVTVPITIDGTTQPGALGTPPITLDATGIEIVQGSTGDGLVLGAGPSIVRGLALGNFPGNGIVVEGGANSAITGNVIGATADGTASRPNGENGIVVEGATGTQVTGNLVSGSAGAGILVTGGSTGTLIHGNKIGTDANGDPADNRERRRRHRDRRRLAGEPGRRHRLSGDGNRIADNGGAAVLVASAGNPILGNSIEANAGGGIDLGTTGNQLQAAPLIAAAHTAGGSLTVIGKFLSPGGTYRLEYFLSNFVPRLVVDSA